MVTAQFAPAPGNFGPVSGMRVLAAGEQPKCRMLYAGFGKSREDPSTESADADPSQQPIKASFPLGSKFFFELTESASNGEQSIPSRFDLSNHKIPAATPTRDPTLFPNKIAIQYDRGATAKQASFRAVHLGTVDLTITPSGSTAIKVQITVTRPVRLGDEPAQDFPDLDDRLINLGHERGIPPHFLRGQIATEAEVNTDRLSYRYEPLTADTADIGYFQGGAFPWRKKPYKGHLEDSRYVPYRLAALKPASYAKVDEGRIAEIGPADVLYQRGEKLTDEDVKPRSTAHRYELTSVRL